MIRFNNKVAKAMEFTKFAKAEGVREEDFLTALLKFEKNYFKDAKGLIFKCYLRNLKGEYADLLFAENMDVLKQFEEGYMENSHFQEFMKVIDPNSVKVHYHGVMKKGFQVPENFACVEHGTFSPKNDIEFSEKNMLSISDKIETEYLNSFENSLGHFMGKIDNETYSEIAFGKTLGKTREICYGYFGIDSGIELMNLYVPESVDLDFWYLIA